MTVPSSLMSIHDLAYSVHSTSPYSPKYGAHHILVDRPDDVTSRWSSVSGGGWVLVQLDRDAIVHGVTFGKFQQAHPCNIKDVRISTSMKPSPPSSSAHSYTLKNDTIPEHISLPSTTLPIPSRFLLIEPLTAHGPNFNISIWHLRIHGIDDAEYVAKAQDELKKYQEERVTKFMLKHLRQRGMFDAYHALLQSSPVGVENELVTSLHTSLVVQGNFVQAETTFEAIVNEGLVDSYLRDLDTSVTGVWRKLEGKDRNGDVPSPRGGHSMCMDTEHGLIYVFGGWDGTNTLDDLWCYNIHSDRWQLLDCAGDAPKGRSCHQLVFVDGCLYLLGRLDDVDAENVTTSYLQRRPLAPSAEVDSEFYRYHVDRATWERVTGNGEVVYDPQMVYDQQEEMIWVFGGRTVSPDDGYAGMWGHHVPSSTWTSLPTEIPGRLGHAMTLESAQRLLLITGGQRDMDYLRDVWTFHLDSGRVERKADMPEASFTHRAVADTARGEVYVLGGMAKSEDVEKGAKDWVYRFKTDAWVPLPSSATPAPMQRYASQIAYDDATQRVYMYGGNVGDEHKRMDDLWELQIQREGRADVVKSGKKAVRSQKFREMCEDGESAVDALTYLKTCVSEVCDEGVADLVGYLLTDKKEEKEDRLEQRNQVFEELVKYVDKQSKMPEGDLVDYVGL